MSIRGYASALFPGVEWTGQSARHVSRFEGANVPLNRLGKNAKLIYFATKKYNYPDQVWAAMQQHFGKAKWLITKGEFEVIYLMHLYRELHGQEPHHLSTRLKNPQTGNRFHRCFVMGKLVGGFRAVVEPEKQANTSPTTVGWRVRIEQTDETLIQAKASAKASVEHAKTEMTIIDLECESMQIKEPVKEEALEKVTIKEIQ